MNDFSGGENLQIKPDAVKPNQVMRAKNCFVNDDGDLETRLGKVKINTSSFGAAPVLGVWRFVKENGSRFLVVQHNTSLWAAAWDGESTVSTWSEVQTGLTTAKLSAVVWKDNLILGNGSNYMFRFNGVSCANLGGSPPKMKIFTIYAGRIWGIDADNPSNFRFCELEDYDLWPALNIVRVRDQDGDVCRGLHPIDGGLVILKDTSVWPLYGTNIDNLRLGTTPLIDTAGCVSNEGSIPGVFFGAKNLYTFGIAEVSEAAPTHTPIFDALTDAEKRAVIVGLQPTFKRALFHIPAKDLTLVADGKHSCITTWEGLNANCFACADGEGDDGRLILGDATTGDIYMLTGSNDAGTPITTLIKTPYNDFGSRNNKIFRRIAPDLTMLTEEAYSIVTTLDLDFRSSTVSQTDSGTAVNESGWDGDFWSTSVWGTKDRLDLEFWLHDQTGKKASIEVQSSSRCVLSGLDVDVTATERE
jgi:hypothetical protein